MNGRTLRELFKGDPEARVLRFVASRDDDFGAFNAPSENSVCVDASVVEGSEFRIFKAPARDATGFTHFLDGAQKRVSAAFHGLYPVDFAHTSAALLERDGAQVQPPEDGFWSGDLEAYAPPQAAARLNDWMPTVTIGVKEEDTGQTIKDKIAREIGNRREQREIELAVAFCEGCASRKLEGQASAFPPGPITEALQIRSVSVASGSGGHAATFAWATAPEEECPSTLSRGIARARHLEGCEREGLAPSSPRPARARHPEGMQEPAPPHVPLQGRATRLLIDGGIGRVLQRCPDARNIVGLVKTHGRQYFQSRARVEAVIGMKAGERTSVFERPEDGLQGARAYSFYLKLRDGEFDSPLFGIVRIEMPAVSESIEMADEIAGWVLHERDPLSLPDRRHDRLLYPIRLVEMLLRSRQPSDAAIAARIG